MTTEELIREGETQIKMLAALPVHDRPVINKVNQLGQLLIEILNDSDRGEVLSKNDSSNAAVVQAFALAGLAVSRVLKEAYGRSF